MTDDELRTIFAELDRIGVDLGRPPGLALGTGFRDGEFVDWLRSLPDSLGHDRFVTRLHARVSASMPNVRRESAGGVALPRRDWPTVEQLNAAVDILVHEWDPLGARLGELTRDDVSEHAYQALLMLSLRQPAALIERQIAEFFRHVESEEFGVRPSPREQRRYLARRIMQVVVDLPAGSHESTPWDEAAPEEIARVSTRGGASGQSGVSFASAKARRKVVGLGERPGDPAPLDPTARCTECGAIGTVAVVTRDEEPRPSRFCRTCWTKARERYWRIPRPRMTPLPDSETPEGQIAALDWIRERSEAAMYDDSRYVASALWDDQLPFFEAALSQIERDRNADVEQQIGLFVDRIIKQTPHMFGPMPPAIADFVTKHGGHRA